MTIDVYIDNNVWDFVFERQIDLCAELPRDEFRICITPEGKREIEKIPDNKADLKAFIEETIDRCVWIDKPFGFPDPRFPRDEQLVGGFDGTSRMLSGEESKFMHEHRDSLGSPRGSGLYAHEGDRALGARAFRWVVLTDEGRRRKDGTLKKAGRLKDAFDKGGMVIYLKDFDLSKTSLSALIKAELARQNPGP